MLAFLQLSSEQQADSIFCVKCARGNNLLMILFKLVYLLLFIFFTFTVIVVAVVAIIGVVSDFVFLFACFFAFVVFFRDISLNTLLIKEVFQWFIYDTSKLVKNLNYERLGRSAWISLGETLHCKTLDETLQKRIGTLAYSSH